MLDNQNQSEFLDKGNVPAVSRERDPVDSGESRAPFWVVALGGLMLAAGGIVIGIRSGGFSKDVYGPEQLYAGMSRLGSGDGAGAAQEKTLAELGKEIYANCQSCHQPSGVGVATPPL